MQIQHLKREEIDKVKWNSAIHYATNGNIYAYMWYLDFIGKDWEALVEGDYESIMPLVWRTDFFGNKELYQPPLMRELGVYSINLVSRGRVKKFLEAIPEEFVRFDITLNEQNLLNNDMPYASKKLTNHQLLINKPYEEIADDFSSDLLKKLELAEQNNLLPKSDIKPEVIAEFYQKHTPKEKWKEQKFHGMQRVMWNILHRGWGAARGVTDSNGNLLAVNFLIYSHKKVLSYLPIVSEEGKAKGAMEYLINMLMRSHAGSPLLFDFNTTQGDPLAKSFGALANTYYNIQSGNKWWQWKKKREAIV